METLLTFLLCTHFMCLSIPGLVLFYAFREDMKSVLFFLNFRLCNLLLTFFCC
uniref:Uncharacterized protein n=1 Tax=Anguilla anguilla TaxID=7936 RepID=A0A0E9X238_ANGAN